MHQAFDTCVESPSAAVCILCSWEDVWARGKGASPTGCLLCALVQAGEGDLGSQGEMGGKRERVEKESEEWERGRQLSQGKGQEQGVRGSEA